MELPKRARTADWESGVLTLDGEKMFEVPELTVEIMERLAEGWIVRACRRCRYESQIGRCLYSL